MNDLKIKITKNKGRGVFANRDFKIGEVIEICPVIVLSPDDVNNVGKTILDEHYFQWKSDDDAALVLGYGTIYNHTLKNNAIFTKDIKNKTMIFKAIKNIFIGEEIFTNYFGSDQEDKEWLWFEDKI